MILNALICLFEPPSGTNKSPQGFLLHSWDNLHADVNIKVKLQSEALFARILQEWRTDNQLMF